MPTHLWGKDLAILAKEIVDGPKRTAPDGTELVEVDGRWYTSDHTRIGSFLQEWIDKEEVPPKGPSTDEGESKLDQLESRLLEGKISEETYERLRKKYERP
jgi:hypothetical protein